MDKKARGSGSSSARDSRWSSVDDRLRTTSDKRPVLGVKFIPPPPLRRGGREWQSGACQCPDADQLRRLIGEHNNEGVARSGRSLRAPDEAVEPKDEGVHLWRAQWYLHYRSAEDAEDVQGSVEIRAGPGRRGQNHSLRGHQTPGAGRNCRRGAALLDVLREPALAGRTVDQLGHGTEISEAAQGARRDGHRWPLRSASEERSHQARARA